MKKELNMAARKVVTKKMAQGYMKAKREEKGIILDNLVKVAGYNRIYVGWLLRMLGRDKVMWIDKERIVYKIRHKERTEKTGRQSVYKKEEISVLKKIWYWLDCPCGQRLAPYLPEILPVIERNEEIVLDNESRNKLLKISARTIDRIISGEKRKWILRGKCRTKPGTLLKSEISIRTFAEWNENKPGFVEMDLVSHDGGDNEGIYAQTLDVTDVLTGWTETIAVKNKSQKHVFEGIVKLRKQFPFDWKGIDSDSGGEFINAHLLSYCKKENLKFTRSRPGRKNDGCYVEQKNWAVVRKVAGYNRYDTEKEVYLLNRVYGLIRLYTNFFQPQMKLISKTRVGSKVIKKYDKAKTPYQRVLMCPDIDRQNKINLTIQYNSLNPVELKRKILSLQTQLFNLVGCKMKHKKLQKKLNTVGIDF